jgi:hypothetical protein
MRFKRRWVVLLLLVAIVTLVAATKIKSQLSLPVTSLNSPTRIVPASLFGMHIHYGLKTWPNVPFYQWRLWDAYVTWGDLEPQQGVWKFELLDRYVELAAAKKVKILLTLGQTPRWASARPNDESPYGNPGWPAEPANMQDWRNYVRTVATRYKGKIRDYEIWNEPDLKGMYTGSVDKMVELAKEAYTVLKQVDPQISVLSPAGTDSSPDFQWQQDFFRRGGGKYADVIAQHFYPGSPVPEDLAKSIDRMKAIMAKSGLARKPLWNTESGWLKPTSIESDRQAMAYVARTYLINWASGVARFHWYAWDNQSAVSLYFTKIDRKTPTPVTKSYAQIQKWMVGAQMKECGANSTKTWICNFTREGQPFWIVWNPDRELNFTVPKNWKVGQIQDLAGKNTTIPKSRQIDIDFSPVLLSATKETKS